MQISIPHNSTYERAVRDDNDDEPDGDAKRRRRRRRDGEANVAAHRISWCSELLLVFCFVLNFADSNDRKLLNLFDIMCEERCSRYVTLAAVLELILCTRITLILLTQATFLNGGKIEE